MASSTMANERKILEITENKIRKDSILDNINDVIYHIWLID